MSRLRVFPFGRLSAENICLLLLVSATRLMIHLRQTQNEVTARGDGQEDSGSNRRNHLCTPLKITPPLFNITDESSGYTNCF